MHNIAPAAVIVGFVMILDLVRRAADRRADARHRAALRAYGAGRAVTAEDVCPELRHAAPGSYSCNLIEHAGRHATAAGANFCMYSRHLMHNEGVRS